MARDGEARRPWALFAAGVIHAIHGVLALGLGVAGLVNGLTEHHIPQSDWLLFAALVIVGPVFAAWTMQTARAAGSASSRRWVIPRAIFAGVLLVGYAVTATGAIGLASTGGMGAGFMVLVAIGMVWLALPELLIVGGAVAVSRAGAP